MEEKEQKVQESVEVEEAKEEISKEIETETKTETKTEATEESSEEIVEESTQEEERELTPDEIIAEAKAMVEKSERETVECINNLDADIAKYEAIKSDLLHNYLNESQTLLDQYDFKGNIEIDEAKAIIDLDNAPSVDAIYVSELSSGKMGGMILGVISALAVMFGWIYLASQALSIKLSTTEIPSSEAMNKILSWIGGGNTGGAGDPTIGGLIVVASGVIMLWAVYAFKVYLQDEHNIKEAKEVTQEVLFYCTKKDECKEEMNKISEHINVMISTIKTAIIFIDEQNATLRRVKHIEGEVDFNELHPKSQDEIRNTKILVIGIEELISTDVSKEDGTLSEEAEEVLEKSIKRHHNYKDKIYS